MTLAEAKLLVERADSYPIDLKNIDSIRDGVETIEKLTEILRNHQVRTVDSLLCLYQLAVFTAGPPLWRICEVWLFQKHFLLHTLTS